MLETINSFTQKPSFSQIISYILEIIMIGTFFGIIQMKMSEIFVLRIVFIALFSILLIMQVISAFITSITDPIDDLLIQYKKVSLQKKQYLKFYYRQFKQTAHNPENEGKYLFCDTCQGYVLEKTRHCNTCKHCVSQFDHHCVWINNCIGKKNYRSFFMTILFTTLILVLHIIGVIISSSITTLNEHLIEMIILWISSFPIILAAIACTNLLAFHIYLSITSQTTYQFIVQWRKARQMSKLKAMNQKLQVEFKLQNQIEKSKTIEQDLQGNSANFINKQSKNIRIPSCRILGQLKHINNVFISTEPQLSQKQPQKKFEQFKNQLNLHSIKIKKNKLNQNIEKIENSITQNQKSILQFQGFNCNWNILQAKQNYEQQKHQMIQEN